MQGRTGSPSSSERKASSSGELSHAKKTVRRLLRGKKRRQTLLNSRTCLAAKRESPARHLPNFGMETTTATSTRKPSWKERLTNVSKVFGVGGNTNWQEKVRENGPRQHGERERRERRNALLLLRGEEEEEAAFVSEKWCVLDADGSDLSFDAVSSRDSFASQGRVYTEEPDVFYTSSEEAAVMEHTDGLLDRLRGAKRADKVDGSASGKSSPAAGASPPSTGIGSRKTSFGSRLRPDSNKITRPGSPQLLQRRSSGRGRAKLDPHDSLAVAANGHASPRSVSPTRSSSRRKQSGSNPPSRNESPNLSEPRKISGGLHVKQKQHQNGKSSRGGSPAGSPSPGGESAFSKVRDTLKISKAKKKLKKKKGSAYSVDPVEINFPSTKYQDPFETQPSYTDSLEVTSKAQSHDFRPVSIPHNKPEYCDHCSETAWGLYRQVLKCSSKCVLLVLFCLSYSALARSLCSYYPLVLLLLRCLAL